MDGERVRKIEAGREKLAAYKKKKQKKGKPMQEEEEDSSFSFSSPEIPGLEERSESSTISEHLASNQSSSGVENDRSLQEIEFPIFDNLPADEEYDRISQENKPPSINSSVRSDNTDNCNPTREIEAIIDDILCGEQFISTNFDEKSGSFDDVSLNIFEGVSLDDSSINNYVSKLRNIDDVNECFGEKNTACIDELEKLLRRKDSELVLSAELESLKEIGSQQSVSSLNTTVTEYKGCHDEQTNRLVDFQHAVAHRDTLIQQLTESLQQSINNREELQIQSENFAKEISLLQKQLQETSGVIRQHRCFTDSATSPRRPEKSPTAVQLNFSGESSTTNSKMSLDVIFKEFQEHLGPDQLLLLDDLKIKINDYVHWKIVDLGSLRKDSLKEILEQDGELSRLRDVVKNVRCGSAELMELREELDARHAHEMEDLRTYFEKKCADLEKNYSEEVFSQQSRKMSGSTTSSEEELLHDHQNRKPGPGGDADPCNTEPSTPKRTPKHKTKAITIDDLTKIKSELKNCNDLLDRYDVHNVKIEDLNNFHEEFLACNLATVVAKYKLNDYSDAKSELEILREDYERKLDEARLENERVAESLRVSYEEQVAALRFELDQALKGTQISVNAAQEVILANSSTDDTEWPAELLQIRNRFAEKYEGKIRDLEEKHEREIGSMKEEHFKVLNGALERARRRSSLRENDEMEIDIVKDRENLKRTNSILRNILGELLKYCTRCEDELNRTLVDEIMKHGFDKNLTQIEQDLNVSNASSQNFDDSLTFKRVHLTPNLNELMTIVDSTNASLLEAKDFSIDLRKELISSLERLKSDAVSILALTLNKYEDSKTNIDSTDLAVELDEARDYARHLESERVSLENQVESLVAKQKILEEDLLDSNKRIAELIECGHKEIVSVGYGQDNRCSSLGGKIANLSELQERARTLVTEWKNGSDHPLLQLVEELCREGERITDEAKKDREDLRQQIEAADKKLRATCQFLEEQAMDREQERDEAQKEIAKLREQLKELEKDKQTRDFVASEVEQLENQMREMTKLIETGEQRQHEVETERKEAIDKIYDLREIIRELEAQVEVKTRSEQELQQINLQLETVLAQQSVTVRELTEQLEAYKFAPDVGQLKDRIVFLEGETQKLKLDNELAGSEGVLKEIQNRLHEFEASIEKKTRVLEGLHSTLSSTTCSTPSEEMSIRDQIRPHTPSSVLEECDVPLQQLARLKEKLIKHSRAEDAAVKRIHDLEMQLHTMKQDFEEALAEKEILQNQVTEQIVLLSSLQMRLDEQRLKADLNQKQANTSLEVRIYDLENEAQDLKEAIRSKEKTVKQLNRIIEETKQRLEDRERELNNKEDDEALLNLQKEIDDLKQDNKNLRVKIESDAQNAQILPGLVDNIIADKNADIEKLRDKLDDTHRQLESFLSLNLDYEQLRQLSQLKGSERAFSDILSLTDFPQARKMESCVDNCDVSVPFKRNVNETTFLGGKFEPEISSIRHIEEVNLTSNLTGKQANSTELHKTTERKVHFEDELVDLRNALKEREEHFEKERLELADQKIRLEETEKLLELSELDNKRKDDMYTALAREKREIQLRLNERDEEMSRLEEQLGKLIETCVALEQYEGELEKKQTDFDALTLKYENLQVKLSENVENLEKLKGKHNETLEENSKLSKDIDNQTRVIENLTTDLKAKKLEIEKQTEDFEKFREERLKVEEELQNLIVDKNCEIEILNEDITRYHEEIRNLESRLESHADFDLITAKIRKDLNERDLEIIKLKNIRDDLNKEIRHLQDYLQEKDRVIEQMQEDTKSLHSNLETIQNKIQETGNIVDLRKRLQEEQHLNAVLKQEILTLKRSTGERSNSIEDIRGEVAKQLEYSATLDSNILQALNTESEPTETLEQERLRSEINELHDLLEHEQSTIGKFRLLLEQEKRKCDAIQIEDTNLIEQLRVQLDAALDNVNELEIMIANERKIKTDLQMEIDRLKTQNSNSISRTETTEYKALPSADNSREISRLRTEILTLNELVERLKSEVKVLKKTRNEQEAALKYTRDLLRLKTDDSEKLEAMCEKLQANEMELRDKFTSTRNELERKEREVENSRQLLGELEQERVDMTKENLAFAERLRELEEEKRIVEVLLHQKEVNLTSTVPEKVLYKMKELTNDVKKQMQENKVMTDTLTKMAIERSKLLDKIRRLEEQNNNRIVCDEPTAKANHLFGKYLRAESYRKALVWQKYYLIKLLLSYQDAWPISKKLVAYDAKHPTKIRSSGIQRFRCCAISLIAVARMKFMVKRWHSGVRLGAYQASVPRRSPVDGREIHVEENFSDTEARFQVGQPVSSQNFYPSVRPGDQRFSVQIPRTPVRENVDRIGGDGPELPVAEDVQTWSGLTPPQKEKFSRIHVSPSLSALEAPQLLTEYVKRFNDIQQRLGITFEKLNS